MISLAIWILKDFAALICVVLFVGMIAVVADAVAHSPALVW